MERGRGFLAGGCLGTHARVDGTKCVSESTISRCTCKQTQQQHPQQLIKQLTTGMTYDEQTMQQLAQLLQQRLCL